MSIAPCRIEAFDCLDEFGSGRERGWAGNLVKEDLETVVDKLYDFVKAGSKVTVKEAALALSITEEQVEKLAQILEESNLLEVQYTLSGSILTVKKADLPKPVVPFAPSSTFVREKAALDDVRNIENVADYIERDFTERLSKARKSIEALNSKQDLTPKDVEELQKELAYLQTRLKHLQSNLKNIETGEESFEQQLENYSGQLDSMAKTRSESAGSGGKQGSSGDALHHFLAFLLIWIQMLIAGIGSKKQAQAQTKTAAPAAISKGSFVEKKAGVSPVKPAILLNRKPEPAPERKPADVNASELELPQVSYTPSSASPTPQAMSASERGKGGKRKAQRKTHASFKPSLKRKHKFKSIPLSKPKLKSKPTSKHSAAVRKATKHPAVGKAVGRAVRQAAKLKPPVRVHAHSRGKNVNSKNAKSVGKRRGK